MDVLIITQFIMSHGRGLNSTVCYYAKKHEQTKTPAKINVPVLIICGNLDIATIAIAKVKITFHLLPTIVGLIAYRLQLTVCIYL